MSQNGTRGMNRGNEQQMIAAQERARKALELRKRGFTYDEIAKHMNMSRGGVHGLVKRAINELKNVVGEAADDVRQLELERLDRMIARLWAQAMPDDVTAEVDHKKIETMLKIMDRRAKYLGLDAAQKHEVLNIDAIDKQIEELERQMAAKAAGEPIPQELLDEITGL